MANWDTFIHTPEYKTAPELEDEVWKDVPGYETLYEISNYGRPRSKDRVRVQRHPSGKMIEHLYKGKLISIDYSTSKFGCLNIYNTDHKESIQIYELVCQTFGQEYADKFFLDDNSYQETKDETWAAISGWQDYEVSTAGHVRRKVNNHYIVMKPWINSGYYTVRLSNNNFSEDWLVHRLVAITFIANPENKAEVNHIDGNKLNNHLENLEWVTKSENAKHAWKLGLSYRTDEAKARATEASVKKTSVPIFCHQTNMLYPSISAASRKLNLDVSRVHYASIHGNSVDGYTFERRNT